jgi:pyruvate dehydrogenase E1 component alpha subunit
VTEAGLLETHELTAVEDEVANLIDQAVAAARAAEPPEASALLTDVYVSY